MAGFEHYGDLMCKLGRYRTGKSCLYIKRLNEIDITVLETLISESLNYMAIAYPGVADSAS